jgi:hypothetical protein
MRLETYLGVLGFIVTVLAVGVLAAVFSRIL